jgi:phosphate starvation-inducible PhoH-like protein
LKLAIEFQDQKHIQTICGPHDAYLRGMLERAGIRGVVREGKLILEGDSEGVHQVEKVVDRLKTIVEKKQFLHPWQVDEALASVFLSQDHSQSIALEVNDRGKRIVAQTAGQQRYMRLMLENDLVFCRGPAGSGKTYLAVAMAIAALRKEKVRKIVLARPAVEAGEKIGFLPGDMFEKVNPFLRPLLDAMREMMDYDQVQRLIDSDVIEILPLAFMRGRTLNDTYMILDEAQNTTVTQMKMFLTRMGQGSRIVVTGDDTQLDLPPGVTSGFSDAVRRLRNINGIGSIRLDAADIVRHPLVRDIVKAYDEHSRRLHEMHGSGDEEDDFGNGVG